jgi:hypothetical protein
VVNNIFAGGDEPHLPPACSGPVLTELRHGSFEI